MCDLGVQFLQGACNVVQLEAGFEVVVHLYICAALSVEPGEGHERQAATSTPGTTVRRQAARGRCKFVGWPGMSTLI